MSVATVQVKFVNQPAAGKKQGSIRLVSPLNGNEFIGVPPAMLAQFQVGGTYKVEYTEREWQGKIYYTATSAAPITQSSVGHTGSTSAVDPLTAFRMFVGSFGAQLASGLAMAGELKTPEQREHFLADLRRLFDKHMSGQKPVAVNGQAGQPFDEEMGDTIPF